MTNNSEIDSKDEEDLQTEGSVPEIPKRENETPASSYASRKKNLSKREIMEELSRARFPWDE